MVDGNISMEEDTELRDLVVQTLENNGVLAKVRAELRASVFLALEEQESVKNPEPLLNKTVKQYLESSEGKLLFSLVREFLEYFKLDYTMSVYDPETYLGKEYNYTGRTKLSEQLGISSTEEPLLGEILKNNINGAFSILQKNNLTTNGMDESKDSSRHVNNATFEISVPRVLHESSDWKGNAKHENDVSDSSNSISQSPLNETITDEREIEKSSDSLSESSKHELNDVPKANSTRQELSINNEKKVENLRILNDTHSSRESDDNFMEIHSLSDADKSESNNLQNNNKKTNDNETGEKDRIWNLNTSNNSIKLRDNSLEMSSENIPMRSADEKLYSSENRNGTNDKNCELSNSEFYSMKNNFSTMNHRIIVPNNVETTIRPVTEGSDRSDEDPISSKSDELKKQSSITKPDELRNLVNSETKDGTSDEDMIQSEEISEEIEGAEEMSGEIFSLDVAQEKISKFTLCVTPDCLDNV